MGLTVHSLPEPALDGQVRQRSGRLKMLLILLVCAMPVLASYFTYYVVRPEGKGAAYSALVDPVPLPAMAAVDLRGQPVPLPELKGQWLMVVVGPAASCAEACEKRLYLQRQLREMLGRERDRVDKLWLITDDAPVAPALASALTGTPAMHMLRVSHEAVASWLKPEAGRALDDHLYLVDPRGDWMLRAPADPDPAKLKRDIDRLLRAAASWDRAGR
ncbi:MAG TPA: hypothetical protein VD932_00625 [Aquabacterium sp.]|nr:hypothetical protein [Aquabacterium sp.]